MPDAIVLDRPVWSMLNGPQSALAVRNGDAVRIESAYGPFAAARSDGRAALQDLADLVLLGEEIWLVERGEWPCPAGLSLRRTAHLVQMLASDPQPVQPEDSGMVPLGEPDADEMTALALATQPGPWGPKTRCYGQFYGARRAGVLAAMAGERMRPAPGFAEVSGVCTDPRFRGQGLAGMLIRQVMAGFSARGDAPFLHSYAANAKAIGLYESLGFAIRRQMVVTVLAREVS